MEFTILRFYRFTACLGKRHAFDPRLAHRHHRLSLPGGCQSIFMGIPIIGIYRDVTSLYLSHHNYAALEGNRKVSVKYMVQASNPTSSVMVMVLVPTPLCEWGGFSPPALWEWGVSCMYVCMYVCMCLHRCWMLHCSTSLVLHRPLLLRHRILSGTCADS